MILQNKKSGKRVLISREQYETLKNIGFGAAWIVISKDDEAPKQPRKVLPVEITDFSKITKKKQTKK